jgi:hypothetical protein
VNARTQPPGRQTEQAAAGTYVEEGLSLQIIDLQHCAQRFFCASNSRIVKHGKKAAPVSAKLKPFTLCNFYGMCTHNGGPQR